jgi:hypothetical protein
MFQYYCALCLYSFGDRNTAEATKNCQHDTFGITEISGSISSSVQYHQEKYNALRYCESKSPLASLTPISCVGNVLC